MRQSLYRLYAALVSAITIGRLDAAGDVFRKIVRAYERGLEAADEAMNDNLDAIDRERQRFNEFRDALRNENVALNAKAAKAERILAKLRDIVEG